MVCEFYLSKALYKGFPGSPEGQESALGLTPGSGGSPGEWLPTPVFLPGDYMDRGAWRAFTFKAIIRN